LDFCLQAGAQGWKIRYAPQSFFVSLTAPKVSDDDRLSLFGKWVGRLWPDQDSYWADDNLDAEKLAVLYRYALSGAAGDVENLTS
jgi:hypothetical protein